MGTVNQFLIKHKREFPEIKYIASTDESMKDPETGKYLEWTLRPIDCNTNDELQQACVKKNKGLPSDNLNDIDMVKYQNALLCYCVVDPDLKQKDLQDAYGVMGATNLLNRLLIPGEKSKLLQKVLEINGFETDTQNSEFQEMIDEAKN